jgi:3-methyladenine DNA glycosylase Tag
MKSFAEITDWAAKDAGGAADLEARLPAPESSAVLRKITDDRYLSTMSLRVFSAGLRHSMVRENGRVSRRSFRGLCRARWPRSRMRILRR